MFMVSEGITMGQKVPASRVHDLLEKFDGMTPQGIYDNYGKFMNSLKSPRVEKEGTK
jgi:hypothetical protein